MAKSSLDESGRVVRRSVELTPGAYMQVVGLVQAFAVGFLLTQQPWIDALVGLPTEDAVIPRTPHEWALTLLQFVATFHLIVLAWHVNAQNMMAFERRWGLLDAFIPMLFIFPEYLMIKTCDFEHFPAWCLGVAGFSGLSLLAYWHLHVHVSREFRDHNDDVLEKVRPFLKYIVPYIFFTGLVSAGIFICNEYPGWLPIKNVVSGAIARSENFNVFAAGVVYLLIIIFTFWHVLGFWHRALEAPKKMKRDA